MKKFKLSAKVTVSAYTVVEAESLESAIEEAAARDVRLTPSGSFDEENDAWCIEDADGSPQEIHEE